MSKNYKVVFQATVDTKQLQAEANKALQNTKVTFNTKGLQNYGTTAKQSAGMLGEFNSQLKNLGSTIPKVAAFGLATSAIGLFTDALRSGVDAVFEMDAALIEFQKVSDLTGQALDEYAEKATNVGLEVARTGSEIISAATEFRKSGFGDEQALELARLASMFQNVADSEVDAGEAASFITSQIKAFKFEAQDYEHILDAINEVSNNFAVSSTDISTALSKTSAAMSVLGNDFEQTIGLVTAGTEILTGQASKVARGLRTIGNNIADTANDMGQLTYQVQGTTKNIELIDSATGDLKSTFQVLGEIAADWDKMSTAEQQAIGISLAGKNQFEVFAAVVDNFEQAVSASETALNSQGSAAQENAKYMEGLQASVAQFKAQWQALANSLISSDFIKFFIDAGTAILKFANSDIGQALLKAGLLAGAFSSLNKLTGGKLITSLANLGAQMFGLASAEGTATLGATGLATAMNAIPVMALITALGALVIHLVNSIKTFEDLKQAVEETNSQIEAIKAEYDQLAGKAPTELTEAEKDRLAVLKEQLEVLKEQKKVQEEEVYEAYQAPTIKTGKKVQSFDTLGGGLGVNTWKDETVSIYEYIKGVDDLTQVTDEAREAMANHAQQLLEFKENGIELNNEEQTWLDTYNRLIEDYQLSQETIGTYGEVVGGYVKQAIDDLNKAIDEQASKGYVTADVYKKLIAMYPQLADSVQKVGNGYRFTDGALQKLINTEYAELSASDAARKAAIQYINSHSDKRLAVNATTNEIVAEIKAMIAEAEAARLSSQLIAKSRIQAAYAGRDARDVGKAMEREYLAIQQNYTELSQLYSLLNSLTSSLGGSGSGSYSGASSSATSATTKQTDAEKELNDALKEQANLLKEAADLMVSKLDIEISKAEEAKQAIEDENKAVEESNKLAEAAKKLADARAKQSLVYQGGQFVYGGNAQEIAEATKEYNEAMQEYIKNKQIQEIEEHIDALKAEQDTWKNLTKTYEDYLGAQGLGIKQEEDAWLTRIGLAQAYAEEYKKIMIAADGGGNGQATLAQAKQFASSLPQSGAGSNTLTQLIKSGYAPTISPQDISSAVGSAAIAQDNRNMTVVNNYNITLPNVSNPTQFVDYFSQKAIQNGSLR